jgi:hypothetical protein
MDRWSHSRQELSIAGLGEYALIVGALTICRENTNRDTSRRRSAKSQEMSRRMEEVAVASVMITGLITFAGQTGLS